MSLRGLLIALSVVATVASSSRAGEWLGGQYIGQISGCGHCGGSLYGLGYCCGGACDGCGDCPNQHAPLPMPMPHPHEDNSPPGVDTIPGPAVPNPPVLRTAHTQPTFASSRRTQRDILPIAPPRSAGGVKAVTHVSQPERLTREPIRIVAPNAWSGPLYR